jgi:hypothetical protein
LQGIDDSFGGACLSRILRRFRTLRPTKALVALFVAAIRDAVREPRRRLRPSLVGLAGSTNRVG